MTTENTDAATRILTKTIRRLTARMTEADQAMDVQRAIYRELLEEQDEVREALGTPLEDVVAAARMRMSAMGERERDVAELRQKLTEMESLYVDLANMRARMSMAQNRMDDAMDALTGDFDADTRASDALDILRGEA